MLQAKPPRSSGLRWLVPEEGRALWGRTQPQEWLPFQLVLTMSRFENNDQVSCLGKMVSRVGGAGIDTGTLPLLANATFPVLCMELVHPSSALGHCSAGSHTAGTLLLIF